MGKVSELCDVVGRAAGRQLHISWTGDVQLHLQHRLPDGPKGLLNKPPPERSHTVEVVVESARCSHRRMLAEAGKGVVPWPSRFMVLLVLLLIIGVATGMPPPCTFVVLEKPALRAD